MSCSVFSLRNVDRFVRIVSEPVGRDGASSTAHPFSPLEKSGQQCMSEHWNCFAKPVVWVLRLPSSARDQALRRTGSAGRTFDCPFVLIGRDRRSGLFLDDGQVSRRHALLQAVDGQVFVFDLQSRSKVCWEGEDAPRAHGWLAESMLNHGRAIPDSPEWLRGRRRLCP